jgi:hypothetical protein
VDPPKEKARRKRRLARLWERMIGPVLWLLARLIDKAIEHHH